MSSPLDALVGPCAVVAALATSALALASPGSPELVTLRSAHFTVAAPPGTYAASRLADIAAAREAALTSLARLFGVDPPDDIRLTLYPDEASKRAATGHSGLGWAEGRSVVEVYNDSIRLDPYHELAHIVGALVGRPPALLDEGFAVYLSERLGADALALLGQPGVRLREAGCRLVASDEALPLETLVDFASLGAPEARGPISYPQSASFVEHLVEVHGLEKLLLAYGRLKSPDGPAARRENREELARIYGRSLAQLEADWRRDVCGDASSSMTP